MSFRMDKPLWDAVCRARLRGALLRREYQRQRRWLEPPAGDVHITVVAAVELERWFLRTAPAAHEHDHSAGRRER